MRDPYLYDDVDVLKNKLNIKDGEKLAQAEGDITISKLLDVSEDLKIIKGDISFKCLQKIHKYIFEDIYEWAGQPRIVNIEKYEPVLNGLSVKYSDHKLIEKEVNLIIDKLNRVEWKDLSLDEMVSKFARGIAQIWQVHSFREGNTRSVILFADKFAKANRLPLDINTLLNHSQYLRNALVMSSIGEYSEYHYLENIFKDAINKGLNEITNKRINYLKNNKSEEILSKKDIELEI